MKSPESVDLDRRRTLSLIGASGLSLAAWYTLQNLSHVGANREKTTSAWLNLSREHINPPPSSLSGTIINIPFAAYDDRPQTQERVHRQLATLRPKNVRVFIPDHFEPEVGEYNPRVTSDLMRFIDNVQKATDGETKCIVSLFDTYNLQHSAGYNPIYGSKPLSHPYLFHAQTPTELSRYQYAFYTSDFIASMLQFRFRRTIAWLKQAHEAIAAWEIANEPAIPFTTDDAQAALSDWHAPLIDSVKQDTPHIPVITGVRHPLAVCSNQLRTFGLDCVSSHIYFNSLSPDYDNTLKYVDSIYAGADVLPLLLTETGFPRSLLGRSVGTAFHDRLINQSVHSLLQGVWRKNADTGSLSIGVGAIGLWQLAVNRESEDGFAFDADLYPKTAATLVSINRVLTHQGNHLDIV